MIIDERKNGRAAWKRTAEFWKERIEFWKKVGNAARVRESERAHHNAVLMLNHYR